MSAKYKSEILNQEKNLCVHGNELVSCEQCLFEQPAWETVRKLREGSDFKRSNETEPNCTIEIEGKKFTIEIVENGEDPVLNEVQKLFEETFGREEVDQKEILVSAVDGLTATGISEPRYRVVVVRNEKGKLVSVLAGGQLDLVNNKGESNGESTYFVGYVVTDKESRQKGLAKEAYISALIDATKEAQIRNKTLKFAIGECTYTSEKFWNRVGWKRVYEKVQGEAKAKYIELKYTQPPLSFDKETGDPTEDSGKAPEHLMIDSFGKFHPNKEDVRKSYEAFMNYFDIDWPENAFNNPLAFENHLHHINNTRFGFREQLSFAGELIFLSATERVDSEKSGIIVLGHDAADHGEAGKEDF